MGIPRRRFLQLAAGAAVLPAVSQSAFAQAYPSQPIRIIVGFAAGSGSDIFARLMAQWLSERLGQSVIVENRAGAGGNIATEAVAKSQPDGYTLLQVVPAHAVNDTLYEKLNVNFLRDLTPVCGIGRSPFVLVTNLSVPVSTVPEFIAYAKANPGKLNFASPGIGTGIHMAGELFKLMAGVNMVHVPYRGAAGAMTDLIGGQVQHVRHHGGLDPAHQSRQGPFARGDHGRALRAVARTADGG
jgi:tripartite-type tricarboxylate transporter receptor subunit TctC